MYTQQSLGILWTFGLYMVPNSLTWWFLQFIINLHGRFMLRLNLWANLRNSLVGKGREYRLC